MNINYYFRNPQCGYSIQRVFDPVTNKVGKLHTVKTIYMPSPYSKPFDVFKNCSFAFKHRDKNGVNHITGHVHDIILGLLNCKTILTIHDLVFLDNVRNPVIKFYKWLFWFWIPIKTANKVTCISEYTKRNILEHIKTDKLIVVYNPIDPIFEYLPKVFAKDKPTILHIGTGWNKNLERTIYALKGIKCHLRIIGKIDNDLLDLLRNSGLEYSNHYGLTNQEIKQEYINCDIVSFASIYEGFGMPIIEGQQTGRVVLTSNIDPMIEVGGKGACFVNPYDIESIRDGFIRLINDDQYRLTLVTHGLENVKRFSLDSIVSQYMDVYENL